MDMSISGNMPLSPGNSPKRSEQPLTDDQQSLITETLSQFDVDNLTEANALTIVKAFSQAGIQPGSALESAVADAGFDAHEIGTLANVSPEGNRPPPPPQQSTEEISSLVNYLTELMEEKIAANSGNALNEEDKQSILAQVFEKYGIENGDSIINTTA